MVLTYRNRNADALPGWVQMLSLAPIAANAATQCGSSEKRETDAGMREKADAPKQHKKKSRNKLLQD